MYTLTKLQKQLITLGFVAVNLFTVTVTTHATYKYIDTMNTITYTELSK